MFNRTELKNLLTTLSPYTVMLLNDNKFALMSLPLTTQVPPASSTAPDAAPSSLLSTELQRYRSPEFIHSAELPDDKDAACASCVYSISVILYEVFTGHCFLEEHTPAAAAELVSAGTNLDIAPIASISPELAALILQGSLHVAKKRLSLQKLRHELIKYTQTPTSDEDESSDASESSAPSAPDS